MIVTILITILVVAVMVGINGLYVAGEFATVSARKARIIQMADGGNALAKGLRAVIEDPHRLDNYIAASQVGITLSSIVLGIYGQNQLAGLLAPSLARLPLGLGAAAAEGTAAVVVLIVLTTLQVVMGELVPKSLALQYPEKVALATALPMRISADYLLKPLIVLLNGSGALILRALGVSAHAEHTHIHSPEEIVILVQDSHRSGLLDADERRMLRSVFRASEVAAGEVAVPRTRIVAVEASSSLRDALHLAANSSYTRIPIYEKDLDHITGFVHLKDLFNLYRQDPQASLDPILRPIPYVPETLPALDVWNRLNQENSYLAVVFDEYGGTLGLVTREDLIEELFGELQDEFDDEPDMIAAQSEGRLVVRGDMAIATFNDLLDVRLPNGDYHTLSGLLQGMLGRIPNVGDEIQVSGLTLHVEAVANHSVSSVRIILPNTGSKPGPAGPALGGEPKL